MCPARHVGAHFPYRVETSLFISKLGVMGFLDRWRPSRRPDPAETGPGEPPAGYAVEHAALVAAIRALPDDPSLGDPWRAARRLALIELEGVLATGLGRGGPLSVAIAGGTQSGKSTLANALLGSRIASEDPRPRATTLPHAFVPRAQLDEWKRGFPLEAAGYATLEDDRDPRGYDEDAAVRPDAVVVHALDAAAHDAVLVDLPDFDSGAPHHRRRALEIAALCDAVVLIASQERYASDAVREFRAALGPVGHELFFAGNRIDADEVGPDMRRTLDAPEDRFAALPEGREALARAPGLARIAAFIAESAKARHAIRARRRIAALSHLRERLRPVLEPLHDAAAAYDASVATWDSQGRRFQRLFREELLDRKDFPELEEALRRWLARFDVPGVTAGIRAVRAGLAAGMRSGLERLGWVAPLPATGDHAARLARMVEDAFANHRAAVHRSLSSAAPEVAAKLRDRLAAPETAGPLDRIRAETVARVRRAAEAAVHSLERQIEATPGWKRATIVALRQAMDLGVPIGAVLLTGGLGPWDLVLGPLGAVVMNWTSDVLLDETLLLNARLELVDAEAEELARGLEEAGAVVFGDAMRPPASVETLQSIESSASRLRTLGGAGA